MDESNHWQWEARINVFDMQTGEIQLIFIGDSTTTEPQIETLEPDISADGRFVTFWIGAEKQGSPSIGEQYEQWTLYLVDRETGETQMVPTPPYGVDSILTSYPLKAQPAPDISADGRYIAFASLRADIVPEHISSFYDIFVYEVP